MTMGTITTLFLIATVANVVCNSYGLSLQSPHISGGTSWIHTTRPEMFDINLYKNGTKLRTCKAAELSTDKCNLWVTAAECVDPEKYDQMQVMFYTNKKFFGVLVSLRGEAYDSYHIHPQYNNVTKEHNIAVINEPIRSTVAFDTELGRTLLPNKRENFVGKTAHVFVDWKNVTKRRDSKPKYEAYPIETKVIDSYWCNFWYRSSPIKNNNICASGWYGKGLNKDDVGAPLVARETNDIFRLVGIATGVRPWAHWFGLPMEFLDIKPYLDWIQSIRKPSDFDNLSN